MKRIYLCLIFMFVLSAVTSAQVSDQTYIRSRTMLKDDGASYIDNIAYYDGLGRPLQTVHKNVKNGTKAGTMLATFQQYDNIGRESITYLPIVTNTDYTELSLFKSNISSLYPTDTRPYTQLVYESSPLKRITQQYGPGDAWYGSIKRPIKTSYAINISSAPYNCTDYSVSSTGTLINNGTFMPSRLYVTQTTDEDGNTNYTFVDKLKRTLLIRQMAGNVAHDTYYVYDTNNRLCFVLQPMYQATTDLNKYTFQYKYDSFNNCIQKKLPGAEAVNYVYDSNDRMAFSQDGNQHSGNKWTFYEYDSYNRLTRQGECLDKNVTSNQVVLVQNYYDNYDFIGQKDFPATNYSIDAVTKKNGIGLLTGKVVIVLGENSKKIATIYHYDIKGQVTKVINNNLLGGYETMTASYTFTGNPANVTHKHTASGKTERNEVYTYTYDEVDRIDKVEHSLNGIKITLVDNTYDNLGRLNSKSLHGTSTTKLTYAYNIRSWLTSIISTQLTQNLYYNTGVGISKYNGNISCMTWKGNDNIIRGYKFSYDGLNRLTNATYGETAAINTNLNRFTENVTSYDKNGNITALQRYGQTTASAYGLIDNLTYTLNGNQLNRVDDAISASAYNNGFEFKDRVKQANEYTYDANGNLTQDLNKEITGITYNVLNLPSIVTFSDKSTITYTYTADGTKLRTAHKIGSATTTTDYCANVIYENGTQKLLLTEEGYVNLTGTQQYHYYLKDHQGNNRVVINQGGTAEETNHYYPFGGVFASTNVQPYKYNGKEFDNNKGLNWYDYGARMYDPTLGRWHAVDPLAEKYYNTSLYGYCGNNPVRFIDLDGCSTWVIQNGTGTYRVVGGDLDDNDRNIYAYEFKDGEVKKKSIGITTSMTSFYNSDANDGKGAWANGSIIDSNDESGRGFLDDFIQNTPEIGYYMENATGGKLYDFKTTNGAEGNSGKKLDVYRGMQVSTNVYSSARDIGNFAAGYIAGVYGIPWKSARNEFDKLQSKQEGKSAVEGMSSQNAQYLGWQRGRYDFSYTLKNLGLWSKSIPTLIKMIQK